jgi:hypothetical protein
MARKGKIRDSKVWAENKLKREARLRSLFWDPVYINKRLGPISRSQTVLQVPATVYILFFTSLLASDVTWR